MQVLSTGHCAKLTLIGKEFLSRRARRTRRFLIAKKASCLVIFAAVAVGSRFLHAQRFAVPDLALDFLSQRAEQLSQFALNLEN
jgi:hypothetical protein